MYDCKNEQLLCEMHIINNMHYERILLLLTDLLNIYTRICCIYIHEYIYTRIYIHEYMYVI